MDRQPKSMLKIGPRSSFNSSRYEEIDTVIWDEKGRNKIAQIFISYDSGYIKSLAFQYVEEDGKLTLSPIFGCLDLNGPSFATVVFKEAGNNEYITKVSGTYSGYGQGLRSLTFETNEATYGPFGNTDTDNTFAFQMDLGHGDQFGGFHGSFCSSSECITSIGVYLKPIQDLNTLTKKTTHDKLSQPIQDLNALTKKTTHASFP